jgi:hypothetical protein
MRPRLAPLVLLTLALACGPGGGAASGDTAAADTAAISGAGSAPHQPPAVADSAADSTRRP